jgi:hypothetical protein
LLELGGMKIYFLYTHKNMHLTDTHTHTRYYYFYVQNFLPLVVNLCLPLDLNDILDTINRTDIVQAIYNIQMVGSINGVSLKMSTARIFIIAHYAFSLITKA